MYIVMYELKMRIIQLIHTTRLESLSRIFSLTTELKMRLKALKASQFVFDQVNTWSNTNCEISDKKIST